jgi:formate dehydrogenase-N alpha subunit
MTNHWTDIGNADVILIMGSNAAENHPISFHWVTEAMNKGATLIHVDPRYTRTSARAHIWAPIRSGTDIAFLGGMIKYIVEDIEKNPQNYNMEYLREYTNAGWLINPGFEFKDGIFSGYNASARTYGDKSTWQYQLDEKGIPKQDKTLKDPNCAFQLLKKHYFRYDLDTVSRITGTPKDPLLKVYQTFASTGKPDRAGTIMYAMGTTQHTVGSQNVRAYSIIQTLLANIGIAGGGINALRGESNVQGATDYFLFHIMPGYLPMPTTAHSDLSKYLAAIVPSNKDPRSGNWKLNQPKYFISMMKAWYGDAATRANDFAYEYLPKLQAGTNYSFMPMFEAMDRGTIKGLLCWGQNPAVGGPNSNAERKSLDKLEWLVAIDLWETETAGFWKRPGVDPRSIKTEVFMLPACASYEKEGSVTNSGRWAQWRYKAIDPPGDAKDDLWIIVHLMNRLRALYSREGGPNAEAITKMAWNYGEHPDPKQVAKEINGYDLTTGKLMVNFISLRDDGTTSCGNWLYSGSFTEDGNMMARRDNKDTSGIGLYSGWAWSWPVNRRIIYNRASVDLNGNPFDPKRAVVRWDPVKKAWSGDVVDGYGANGPTERYPFIMQPEGVARLFGMGMADGPFPEHYEAWESPVKNIMSSTQLNPAARPLRPQEQGTPDRFPYIGTTYRVSEHWQAGAMTRNLPWLAELFPEMFVEIGEELAAEKGIKNGQKVIVESARGQVTAVAIVTKRLIPLQVDGKKVHHVGLPWHWGYSGISTGDSANLLTPYIGDPNTMMPEFKTFLVNIRRA